MNKVQKQTKVNQEGYGLGVIIAWGVEVNGEFDPDMIFNSRAVARRFRNEWSNNSDSGEKYIVRKLEIRVVEGR